MLRDLFSGKYRYKFIFKIGIKKIRKKEKPTTQKRLVGFAK